MSDLFNMYVEAGSPYGYCQPESAIRWAAEQLTAAQSEKEALRARVAELEDFAALAQTIGVRQLDPDFVMPGVEADMKVLIDAAQNITKEDEGCDYESPWLLRKQAEAVEAVTNRLKYFADTAHDDSECVAYRHGAEFATDEANRLRQQADELDKVGGSHEA